MTAILVEHRKGTTRRCDAVCHLAKDPTCTCVCKGRYHGVGQELARDRLIADLAEGGEVAAELRRMAPYQILRQVGQAQIEEPTGA